MKKIILTLAVTSMFIACCTTKNSTNAESASSAATDTTAMADTTALADTLINRPLLGGDRDEHGCIPSAGYIWCEKLQKCVRPWETPCE